MPEETRIFDVSKPGRSSPHPTSKPVIVGHHPVMNDPMMKGHDSAAPIPITVHDDSAYEAPTAEPLGTSGMSMFVPPEQSEKPAGAFPQENRGYSDTFSGPEAYRPDANPVFPSDNPAPREVQPAQPAYIEGLHTPAAKKRKKPVMMTLFILLVLLIGAYLFVDSGVVDTGINLPFHVFKQKSKAPEAAAIQSGAQSQAAADSLPAGFTIYKLSGTSLTFAAPTAWGTPTSTADPGYSVRSSSSKSDGTYAYLVDFATNKDVEIAVTSSKYLPPARAALYYDFLRWCTGTNDNKIYQSVLRFTTAADKTDTPSTVTCDNGPLAGATQLDSTTIVQLNLKSADGKTVFGDLYTKNLSATDLPVFRVKDAKSANGDDIKKLLLSVKLPAGSTTAVTQ